GRIQFESSVLISLIVVNLFGSDGQIAEEILVADSEKDSITVEFKQGDGTHITAVFDFKRVSELNILKSRYFRCFISRLNHHQITPTESMARLRQRNPNLVRRAEERCGVEHLHMDMVVNMSRAGHLNTLIHNVCKEAHEGFYTQTVDTKHWLDKGKFGFHSNTPLVCSDAPPLWICDSPVSAVIALRLEWLPCLLKYCHSRLDVAGRANPYKCGIRSCSKGYRFDYYVPHRKLCPWDEET
uniref:Out at first protein homolog n=1 Tax=Oncorhynchus mykiss TaxID=8022 RepID=A0A8C7W400_ONCMY